VAALRGLSAGSEASALPVLVLVAAGDAGTARAAYRAGAFDVRAEPLDWAVIAERLATLVGQAEQARQLLRCSDDLLHAQRLGRMGSWELQLGSGEIRLTPEARRIFGIDPEQGCTTLGDLLERLPDFDRVGLRRTLEEAVEGNRRFLLQHRMHMPDGSLRHLEQAGEAVEQGEKVEYVLGTVRDVTEQREAEKKMRRLANYDALTGLATRHLFLDRLREAIEQAKRRGHRIGLLYLDLDQFKRINDTLGHVVGDALLQRIAVVLRGHVRPGRSERWKEWE